MSAHCLGTSVGIHASIQKVHTDVSVHLGCTPLKLGSTNVWVSYVPLDRVSMYKHA